MLSSKEKKLQKAREEEEARANAEFEAKLAAKQERKNVEKQLVEIGKVEKTLLERAASAKAKGYTEVYRSCVSMIKVARARKKQAEIFLFQVETMQAMQALAKGSAALLTSMGNVMGSLGKLSLDKTAMLTSQKDFASVQRELDRQTMSIESYLDGMDGLMSDDSLDLEGFKDSDIEAEIDALMSGDTGEGSASGTPGAAGGSQDAEMERIKQLLNM